jgi:hypothetical protein
LMGRAPALYADQVVSLTGIETLLSNYRHQVLAVADRAREWLLLDEEERRELTWQPVREEEHRQGD